MNDTAVGVRYRMQRRCLPTIRRRSLIRPSRSLESKAWPPHCHGMARSTSGSRLECNIDRGVTRDFSEAQELVDHVVECHGCDAGLLRVQHVDDPMASVHEELNEIIERSLRRARLQPTGSVERRHLRAQLREMMTDSMPASGLESLQGGQAHSVKQRRRCAGSPELCSLAEIASRSAGSGRLGSVPAPAPNAAASRKRRAPFSCLVHSVGAATIIPCKQDVGERKATARAMRRDVGLMSNTSEEDFCACHSAYVQLAQKRPDGLRSHVEMCTRQPCDLVPATRCQHE